MTNIEVPQICNIRPTIAFQLDNACYNAKSTHTWNIRGALRVDYETNLRIQELAYWIFDLEFLHSGSIFSHRQYEERTSMKLISVQIENVETTEFIDSFGNGPLKFVMVQIEFLKTKRSKRGRNIPAESIIWGIQNF